MAEVDQQAATIVTVGKQYFAGRTYAFHAATRRYRASDGRKAKRVLHRDVYSAEYGNIPHGWHVHHKDEDPHNNEIENLQAMAPSDHAGLHRLAMKDYACSVCDTVFQSSALHGKSCYCSKRCSNKYWNARMAERKKHG